MAVDQGEVLPGTKYRVLGQLGSGGQGTVFRVEHVEIRRLRALKILESTSEETAARMKVEWEALAELVHENVVNVIDVGVTADGAPYFVMDLLEGETLGDKMHREGRMPAPVALPLIKQVLRGLAAAHRAGIVHRDIKPANVFITIDGAAKLIDFGYARTASSAELSREGVVVGSPSYMSPEQAEGKPLDERTDIYAVGVLLFEMLSGVRLFPHAPDGSALEVARAAERAPSVSEHSPDVPEHVSAAIDAALSKMRFRRPASASEFLAMLDDPSRGKPRRNFFTSGGLVMIGIGLGFLAATQTAYGPRERLTLAVGPAACQPVTVAPVTCPPPEPAVTVAAAAPGPRRSVARAAAPPPPAPVASTKPRYRSFADLTVDDLPPSGM